MKQLQVVNANGQLLVDSREVAEMVGKQHAHLLRDIKGYIEILNQSNFGFVDFFIENTYTDGKGESRPSYLLTRKGCDMVANKMTGEKGVLFTATYVTKFEEMEKQIANTSTSTQIEIPASTLHAEKLLTILRENQSIIGPTLAGAFQNYVAEVLTGKPLHHAPPVDLYHPPYAKVPLAIQPQNFISQQTSVYEKWYLTSQIADEAGVSTQMVAVVAKQNGLKSAQYSLVARTDPNKASGLVQIFYNAEARAKLLKLLAGRKSRSRKRVRR